MADTSFFARLARLFSTNVIVRRIGKNRLKVVDTSRLQSTGNVDNTRYVDRYSRMHGSNSNATAINQNYNYQSSRIQLFGDFECLAGETKIPLPDGSHPTIAELALKYPGNSSKFYVFSYDHENDCIKLGEAHSVRKTKTEMTYKVTFDNGEYLIATDNHPFLMRTGKYTPVQELKVGDSLMPFYRKNFYSEKYNFVYNFSKKWQSEHKIVAEQFHREMLPGEVVHHKDFQKYNNLPDNLQIMSDHDHRHYHSVIMNKNHKWSPENRERQIAAQTAGNKRFREENPVRYAQICKEQSRMMKEKNPNFTHPITEESRVKKSNSLKKFYKTHPNYNANENNGNWKNGLTYQIIENTAIELYKTTGKITKAQIKNKLKGIGQGIEPRIKQAGFNSYVDFKNHIKNTLNHKITSIEPYEVLDVYDMTVDKYNNFATENVFVHNSMDTDALISSVLDICSDESTLKNSYDEVLAIKSSNENVRKILYNLFYDILNIEFNLWPWIRNMCVDENTIIPLLDGRSLTIKDLSNEMKLNPSKTYWVYSNHEQTQRTVPGKIKWCGITQKNAKIVRVRLDDNTYIDTTPDHKFLLRNGSKKEAQELTSGDSLMPLYTKLTTKTNRNKEGYEKVYNPASNRYNVTHRLVAYECGISNVKEERKTGQIYHTHHVNFDKKNNSPKNLRRMTASDHAILHSTGSKIFARPDIVKKRMAGIDKWLRSENHSKMVSERQKGIYPKHFQEYNNSMLHKEHDKIKSDLIREYWKNGRLKPRPKLILDERCLSIIAETVKNHSTYIGLETLANILKLDDNFLKYFKEANKSHKYNVLKSINLATLKAMIMRDTGMYYCDFLMTILPTLVTDPKFKRAKSITDLSKKIINHKVTSIEFLDTTSDVYCMEVVGPNNEEDRHNFAVCSKNTDGSYSRNGVFVSNCKYGDHYLWLHIQEGVGIVNVLPISAYEMVREEGMDPQNPYEVKFFRQGIMGQKESLKNYEVAHFRLLSDSNFLPYGKSYIEGARKTWKQLVLLEDAMLIHRIMRAPEKRVFKIDVGNIPPNEVDQHMKNIINGMKKTPFVDETTGEMNLKYNMQNVTEDFYLPTRGTQTTTDITTLPGLQYQAIDDVTYLKDKMLAALKVPKAFLGMEEKLEGGKATLAAQDIRFARTIERIQRIVCSELTKIAIVHLAAQGYTDASLVDFELALTGPSTVYEQEKLQLWTTKATLARDIKELQLLSDEWLYKNIFNMSTSEFGQEQLNVINNLKLKFRRTQIENEGNDPVATGQSFGTPHDIAALHATKAQDKDYIEKPKDGEAPAKGDEEEWMKNVGRPKQNKKYGTDDSPFGRDPIGADAKNDTGPDKHPLKHNFKGNSPLSQEGVRRMVQLMKDNKKVKTPNIINESLKTTEVDGDKGTMLDENNLLKSS